MFCILRVLTIFNVATNEMVSTWNRIFKKRRWRKIKLFQALFSRLFLDHFRLHKPEGSKNSQCCDAIFTHLDSLSNLRPFLSFTKKYARKTSDKIYAGGYHIWGVNLSCSYALLGFKTIGTGDEKQVSKIQLKYFNLIYQTFVRKRLFLFSSWKDLQKLCVVFH